LLVWKAIFRLDYKINFIEERKYRDIFAAMLDGIFETVE